jgi:hypothetical protein
VSAQQGSEEAEYRRTVAAVSGQWAADANGCNAEMCRRAMLACFGLHEYAQGYVWRARALRLAWDSADRNALAALYIQESVRILTAESVGRPADSPWTRPSAPFTDAAALILEEVTAILDGGVADDGKPTPATLWSLLREKRALVGVYQGRYSDAEADYTIASKLAEADGDRRRTLKATGGLALARYLGGASPVARDEQALATEEIAAAAAAEDIHDVARMATENALAMRAGSLDVLPYELL